MFPKGTEILRVAAVGFALMINDLVQGPEVAQVIEKFLTQPTSQATQFAP